MSRKILFVLITALIMGGLMMPVSTAYAAPVAVTTIQKKLTGKVAAVNSVKKTITVKSNIGKLVTVKTNQTTTIKRDGKTVGVNRVLVGDKFTGYYAPATRVASSVNAQETPDSHAEVYGTVYAVDTAASSITIDPGNGGANVTLLVDADTELERNDDPATLADFVVGDNVEAEYDPASMLASEISANVDDDCDCDDDDDCDCDDDDDCGDKDDAEMYGLVSAVDVGAGTMTVLPVYGGAEITFTVNADTELSYDDAPATLSSFVVGDAVEVEYDPATLIAFEIDCE